MFVCLEVVHFIYSSEGHFVENDPTILKPAATEQMAFLIHANGGDQ